MKQATLTHRDHGERRTHMSWIALGVGAATAVAAVVAVIILSQPAQTVLTSEVAAAATLRSVTGDDLDVLAAPRGRDDSGALMHEVTPVTVTLEHEALAAPRGADLASTAETGTVRVAIMLTDDASEGTGAPRGYDMTIGDQMLDE